MYKAIAFILLGTVLSSAAFAQRSVFFNGGFETGRIQSNDSSEDGFYIQTLPTKQVGSEIFGSGGGCCTSTSAIDTRVVASRIPPVTGNGKPTEVVVLPRRGKYFLESSLHYEKDYTGLNGGKPKARSKMPPGKHLLDYDVETYTGFSIYLPSNLEIEKQAKRTVLLGILPQASSTLMSIELSAPEVGASRWAMLSRLNDGSITEGGATPRHHDLGAISADLGKWTDFVIRHRWNPFGKGQGYACPVNPVRDLKISGSKDQKFQCDTGILQVWKSTGKVDKNGDRVMTLMVDYQNVPVGLVPKSTQMIRHNFQVYKPQWQQSSTTVKGPVWIGFDEIRFGSTSKHSTSYVDVNPGGSLKVAFEPKPPSNLSIVN
jgi:hypothetical protein